MQGNGQNSVPWNQLRHVRTSPYPLTNSLVFHLPFLLGDTVSSASLHRLTESWGRVQSMFRITRRNTTERPVAKADPLKLWTSELKKGFPPILWKAVFSPGKQVFLIRGLCGEGKRSVSRKNQALAHKMIASLNLVSSFKFTRVSCEISERLNKSTEFWWCWGQTCDYIQQWICLLNGSWISENLIITLHS